MANYTLSIRDILQKNAEGDDIHTIDGIYNTALRCLFPQDALNVISDEYRKNLVVGFSQHYFNDEIGYETLVLWKMALSEKLYNNASYINQIYENLDKQIFADYKIKAASKHGEGAKSKDGTGSLNIITSASILKIGSETDDHSESGANSKQATNAGTGTVDNKHTGTETIADTGTVNNQRGGTDTIRKTGTASDAKTGTEAAVKTGGYTDTEGGSDTLSHQGKVKDTKSGYDVTANSGTDEVAHTGTDTHAVNGVQLVNDTPMGSLANMRTPGGDATGQGVAYATNRQTYNYLSGAQENDSTDVNTLNTLQTTTLDDESRTDYHSANEREFINNQDVSSYGKTLTRVNNNETDTTTHNTTNTHTDNLSEATQYGATDLETRALQNQTTHNTDELETRNTLDTLNESGTTSGTARDVKSATNSTSNSGNTNQSSETSSDETSSNDETISQTDKSLNWEMLYRSMPLLNKVWELFDDLFMLIY